MNNRQPNRRRGRGNNRVQNNNNNNRNGFDNANRIDNRARGNASQMLEKYKKLASDAQLNGDRVNAEYYLQFADHYFRVLADFRSRQEEGRPQREWRGDDRENSDGGDWRDDERDARNEDDADGNGGESIAAENGEDDDYRRPQRPERNDRPERDDRPQRNDRPQRDARPERNDRPERTERPARDERNDRGDRNPRPRRDRNEQQARPDVARQPREEPAGLDLAVLPPSIGFVADDAPVEAEKPARKPRAPRRPKSANDEDVVTAAE